MLSQLIYTSARDKSCTEQEIEKILDSCKRNNAGIDITGVLLYSDTHFVQYIEGKYKTIIDLYDRIKTDTRHKNVVLISTSLISKRLFPSWQMGAKKVDSLDVDFLTEIGEKEKAEFSEVLKGDQGTKSSSIQYIRKFFV